MKRLRVLQILNFWRLIPAYMCICMAPVEVKHVVIEELYHWKKCDKRKEVSRFDIFSGLMLERKEYRSLLQYRFNRGGWGAKLLLKVLFPGIETLYLIHQRLAPDCLFSMDLQQTLVQNKLGVIAGLTSRLP